MLLVCQYGKKSIERSFHWQLNTVLEILILHIYFQFAQINWWGLGLLPEHALTSKVFSSSISICLIEAVEKSICCFPLCSVVKRNCLCIWQAGKSWNIWLLDGKSSSECEPKKWHCFMCFYIEIQVQAILAVLFQKPKKFSAFPVSWNTVHFWETNLSVTFPFTIIIFLEEKWFHGVLLGLSAGRNNEPPFAIL